ncbi:MAG: class I SAM-dependent methyltransferase [Vicinamibacteria bacterium]|nr:class I SAM-dependent methyltransferase [Vicinamibacteria bacterium]
MSLETLREHRRVFAAKPVLGDVYGVWFDRLLEGLPGASLVLEAGAGPGLFAPHAKAKRPDLRWIALDLIEAPWNDIVADAQVLPFRDGTIDAVLGVDFVHHLSTPLEFFRDVARVLKPGGELRVIEPWVSPFSYPVYRFLHQEGATLGLDPARPFSKGDLKAPFEGDAGVTRAIATRVDDATWRRLGYAARPTLTPINGFAYLLSLGFKPPSLLPRFFAPAVMALDRLIRPRSLTAMRIDLRARKAP